MENSSRGVWSITKLGREIGTEEETLRLCNDKRAERHKARRLKKKLKNETEDAEGTEEIEPELLESDAWEDGLLEILREMDPSGFERLCQRLLREAGFSKVEVTGKSGDGGIDGVGVLKVNLLSFHVRFQCKRYAGAVSSSDIRNFRGAMQGRADKGLFITTGRYTKDAEAEAIRDGAPAIDLINGMELCALLKEYGLGVVTEKVEKITFEPEFFEKV